jgi:hypothetical protein
VGYYGYQHKKDEHGGGGDQQVAHPQTCVFWLWIATATRKPIDFFLSGYSLAPSGAGD